VSSAEFPYMNTLEAQKQRLENEIIRAKARMLELHQNEYPDLNLLGSLKELVERNFQLISMIDQHTTANVHRACRRG